MTNNIYAIYNILSKRYNDIFQYPTDEFARQRIQEVGRNHPEILRLDESELYKLGSFDVETGEFIKLEKPVQIEMQKPEKTGIENYEKELTKEKS